MADAYFSKHRFARISPRKVRLIVDLIRGRSLPDAFALLRHNNQRGALMVDKVIRSAWANAQAEDAAAEEEEYVISKAFADEGPTIFRGRPASMGRYVRIRRRTSHIHVEIQSSD